MNVLKKWFFESLIGSTGDRFNTGNKPTKDTFKNLVDSTLNPLEVSDTAKTDKAGHVKVVTDANAYDRTSPASTEHTQVVMPHQLPNIETDAGVEINTKDLEVKKGGLIFKAIEKVSGSLKRKNFRLSVNVSKSVKITDEAICLDGDVESVADDSIYSKIGTRGWNTITAVLLRVLPSWTWVGGTVKYLSSNGVSLGWSTVTGGNGGYSPDNKSISLNEFGNLQLKCMASPEVQVAVHSGNAAPALSFITTGAFVKVDGQTLSYNQYGELKVMSGSVANDDVVIADDFINDTLQNKWGNENVAIVADDPNGAIELATTTLPQSAHIEQRPGLTYEKRPSGKFRFRLELAEAISSDSPDIYFGIIGDGSSVTLGDFAGFTIDKTSGKWKSMVKINGVIQQETVTTVDADLNWHTVEIMVGTDKSATFKIDDQTAFSYDPGICLFDSTQNIAAHLINVVSESNKIIIDYINTSRARSSEIPN